MRKKWKGRVVIEQAGLTMTVDDVPVDAMPEVAADLMDGVRLLAQVYPDVRERLDVVPGGYPVPVTHDEWAEDGRRQIGFRPRKAGTEKR
jgi:hypothetical protein